MEFKDYLNQKKTFQQNFLDHLDSEEENNQEFINLLKSSKIVEDRRELIEFLHLFVSVINNHHRSPNFFEKIEEILLILNIGQTLTSSEIYNIFKDNKRLLLSLIQSNILSVDDFLKYAYNNVQHFENWDLIAYLWPEVGTKIHNNRYNVEHAIFSCLHIKMYSFYRLRFFQKERERGENDDFIAELIRKDEINEFILYVNQNNINLSSNVKYSIFECNNFLLHKNTTLIEYAAFYGSIQIFQYLRMNKVELTSSLPFYAIHSNNPEMIHLIEELKINGDNEQYDQLYIESVKCHHNDIANYYKENKNFKVTFIPCFQYFNYICFPEKFIKDKYFITLTRFNYPASLEVLLRTNDIDVNVERIFLTYHFFYEVFSNEIKFLYDSIIKF